MHHLCGFLRWMCFFSCFKHLLQQASCQTLLMHHLQRILRQTCFFCCFQHLLQHACLTVSTHHLHRFSWGTHFFFYYFPRQACLTFQGTISTVLCGRIAAISTASSPRSKGRSSITQFGNILSTQSVVFADLLPPHFLVSVSDCPCVLFVELELSVGQSPLLFSKSTISTCNTVLFYIPILPLNHSIF